ncbi:unnamed protein product, partial [Rotaria socialis]
EPGGLSQVRRDRQHAQGQEHHLRVHQGHQPPDRPPDYGQSAESHAEPGVPDRQQQSRRGADLREAIDGPGGVDNKSGREPEDLRFKLGIQ